MTGAGDTPRESPQATTEPTDDRRDSETSAEFLVEEFGVEAADAAALVSEDSKAAEEIMQHEYERERNKDPLENVPTPKDHDFDATERVHKHMHKEVVRVDKD